MCTVTYIPQSEGFIFTSNRDEQKSRSNTKFPQEIMLDKETVIFPKDPEANGTWIAISNKRLVCLLNGGFSKHKRTLPYRKSRGLIVLERFNFKCFTDFYDKIDLSNIEPFTLVSVEFFQNKPIIYELVWDGNKKHLKEKDNSFSHIWSSSTLYTDEIKAKRKLIFSSIKPLNSKQILDFHYLYDSELGNENSFKMIRNTGVETISTTQIEQSNNNLTINYINHITNKTSKFKIH